MFMCYIGYIGSVLWGAVKFIVGVGTGGFSHPQSVCLLRPSSDQMHFSLVRILGHCCSTSTLSNLLQNMQMQSHLCSKPTDFGLRE